MSPFLLLAKARELHHQYSRTCIETREIIRSFYHNFERTGALPLGLSGQDYHWVTVHEGKFPVGESQQAFIAASTPAGYTSRVHRL